MPAISTPSAVPTVPIERVTEHILVIRGEKVLLDSDLAELYGVETKVLVQAVKRNGGRFPGDFMFQLDAVEWAALRSQFVTSKVSDNQPPGRGGRRYAPYAFTEQGVAMLASVLGSAHAIAVNISIVRAFVRLRELLSSNKALASKLDDLERKLETHDQAIVGILTAMRELANPAMPVTTKRPIGFVHHEEKKPEKLKGTAKASGKAGKR